eukprot:ANDGO_02818.mRNA.1 hypothetical protein
MAFQSETGQRLYSLSEALYPPVPRTLPSDLPDHFFEQSNVPSCLKALQAVAACKKQTQTDAFCQDELSRFTRCKVVRDSLAWEYSLEWERKKSMELSRTDLENRIKVVEELSRSSAVMKQQGIAEQNRYIAEVGNVDEKFANARLAVLQRVLHDRFKQA